MQPEYTKGNLSVVGQDVTLDVRGLASLSINLKGSFVGTVIFEYQISEDDWKTLTVNVLGSATTATGATAVGSWTANVAAMRWVRVRCTAYTSGPISVDMIAVQSGGGSSSSVGGSSFTPANVAINGSFTRPADTAAYAAGDAVTDSTSAPTVVTFTNVASANGKSGIIVGATLVDSANQSTKGLFELWLFDTTVTPDNDNAVFTPSDAELATLVGVIPFDVSYVGDATSGAGGNAIYSANILNLAFVAGASSRNLFGVLVARNAYTPVSGETFTVRLNVAQN